MEFEIPIVYSNIGRPPRHRNETQYVVVSRAKVAIPEVDPVDFTKVLSISSIHSSDIEPVYVYNDQPYRQLGDGHQQWWPTERFIPWGQLDNLMRKHLPTELRVPGGPNYEFSSKAWTPSELSPKHISVDGYAAAVAALQDQVDRRLVSVGGTLYRRSELPVYSVWVGHDKITLSSTRTPQSGQYTFSPECLDDARAFASYCADRLGLPMVDKISEQAFEVHVPGIPLGFNPIHYAVSTLVDLSRHNVMNIAPYGWHVKQLAESYCNAPSTDSALAFALAFEESADALPEDDQYKLLRRDHARFDIIREFADYLPPEYLPASSAEIRLSLQSPFSP